VEEEEFLGLKCPIFLDNLKKNYNEKLQNYDKINILENLIFVTKTLLLKKNCNKKNVQTYHKYS
jgi:hypothetical protein